MSAFRGLAALIVLFGHTYALLYSPLFPAATKAKSLVDVRKLPASVPRISHVSFGNEAVIIFFVLSGYLVGGSVFRSLRNKNWSWETYLSRRLTRLWVVLIPALFLGVAVDLIGMHIFANHASIYNGPMQQAMVPADLVRRFSFPVLVGNIFFLQSILVSTAGTNDSLWSLANEFWYYICFPLLLLAFTRHSKLYVRLLYLLGFVAVAAFVGKGIMLLFLLWLLGALLYLVPLRLHPTIARQLLAFSVLELPVLLIVIRRSTQPIFVSQGLVAIAFALILYAAIHQQEPSREGLYKKTAEFFSQISYSMYLVHMPLAVFVCAVLDTPWHPWARTPLKVVAYLALNTALIAVSYLFYILFEKNTERIRRAIMQWSGLGRKQSTAKKSSWGRGSFAPGTGPEPDVPGRVEVRQAVKMDQLGPGITAPQVKASAGYIGPPHA